jgi:cell shape-determining protein MreC
MSYEHKSNVNVRNFSIPAKFSIFVIIFLILLCILFPRFVSGLFIKIAGPFWNIEKDIKTEKIRVSIDLQNTTILELEKENSDLKEIMARNASSSPMLLSYIVKKPPFTAYDSYIIDIGKSSGVKIGDKVYANGNVLLGEIVEINGSFAKVKLYSSYGEKFDVLIGKNDIEATATGKGGGAFEVVLPKDSRVQINDSVSAPDLNVSVFGIVKNISRDPVRSFSTVLFSQPLNIYEQKWVQVKLDK